MAKKTDYPPAYLDVFNTLLHINGYYSINDCYPDCMDSLDTDTQKLALKYLMESAKRGNSEAKKLLDKLEQKE